MESVDLIGLGDDQPKPWPEMPTHGSYEDIPGFVGPATTAEAMSYRLGQAHEELREAKAEIDRLQNELAMSTQTLGSRDRNIADVVAENILLRGLASEMFDLADNWPGIAYTKDLTARVAAALDCRPNV